MRRQGLEKLQADSLLSILCKLITNIIANRTKVTLELNQPKTKQDFVQATP